MIELHSQREPEPKRGSSPVCPRIQSGRASERAFPAFWSARRGRRSGSVRHRQLSGGGGRFMGPAVPAAAQANKGGIRHIYAALLSRVQLRSPPLALALVLGGTPRGGRSNTEGEFA